MRIQILGINYAPERTGVAPYTTGLARHFARSHEVTVITGLPHYPDWSVPRDSRRWHTESRDGDVRVVRVWHHVPSEPKVISRAMYELTWAARAAAAGIRRPADVVIAVIPALLAGQAGWVVARRQKVPLGIVLQDVMGTAAAQSGLVGGRLASRATLRLERSALRHATAVSTIHPSLARELTPYCAIAPSVTYNWTHVAPRPRPGRPLREQLGWGEDEIIALHSGNMGSKQNLEVVVDAARLAEFQGRRIRFVLAGAGNQRAKLAKYASGCAQISFMESVDDEIYMDLLASADILLVNERPGMTEMSLPSKLTSYLVAGRPIVAATDAHSATAEFVRASGGGIVTPAGHHAALLDAISQLAGNEEQTRILVSAGLAFANEHLSEEGAMAAYDRWLAALTDGQHRG